MTYLRHFLSTVAATLAIQLPLAQEINGHVTSPASEEQQPLSGAYLIWLGTAHGTISNADGSYNLQMLNNGNPHHLIISYVGYQSDTVYINAPGTYDFSLQPILMDDVEIRQRRLGNTIDRLSPQLTENVSADELSKAACCNLGESFQTNASVDVNYADAATGAKTIQLLGLQGRYVQMMSENVPSLRGIASPYGLSYIPGPWMNGIQLSKGVGTVVNGYEAITGQINIDFKKPVATNEVASLNLYSSTAGKIEANASANIKVGPQVRTNIMLNFSNNLTDMDHNNDGFRDEPRTKQLNLFNRWYRHTDRHTLDIVLKSLNEQRLGGQTAFHNSPQDGIYGVQIETDRLESWMKNGFTPNNNFSIGFPIGYTYHHQSSSFGNRSYTGTQHSYNFNSIANFNNGATHEFHTGISSQGDFYREHSNINDTTINTSHNDLSLGLYAQYTLRLDNILSLIIGLRADHHNHYGSFLSPRIHLMLTPTEHTSIRLAAGKGRRAASLMAETNHLLTSARHWHISDTYGQEIGWNFGGSITQYLTLFNHDITLIAEYFHTSFSRQLITDLDQSPHTLHAYFSNKHSWANNLQLEARANILRGLDLTAAWRYNNNQLFLNNHWQRRPLTSRYKALIALSYQTPLKTWQFDTNLQLNGGGRIPSTLSNPTPHARPDTFHSYQLLNAQLTKWFRRWSIYIGCENINNYTQPNPIISPNNPFSDYFDASLIYGPLMPRRFYLGLRWHYDKY